MTSLTTDLSVIKAIAAAKEDENDAFRRFIKNSDSDNIDKLVNELNERITPQIDCTQCGNCCKSLIISISAVELDSLANHLNMEPAAVKTTYLEESEQGQLIMKSIPCNFLTGTRCSIYEHRFSDCREFPHLHKKEFSSRLFSMLMHYGTCPIIFNVMEALKTTTGFINR